MSDEQTYEETIKYLKENNIILKEEIVDLKSILHDVKLWLKQIEDRIS